MSKILAIVGPTASGKSSLALRAAEELDGEIVCVDSQTIRKGLDIGTAKPSQTDQARVPHHLLDIIEPYESFSAAEFKRRAMRAIDDICGRGKLPVLVGGTGLYMDAILFDFDFNDKADEEVRAELNKKSVSELQQIVQDRGIEMPSNEQNPRHLIRAIESEGRTPQNASMREDVIVVGLDPGDLLPQRIQTRVEGMLEEGLKDEVAEVLRTYGEPPEQWDAIGYSMLVEVIMQGQSELSDSAIIESISQQHRQYAKRQRAWFKRNEHIMWFEQSSDALNYVQKQLSYL